jgi:hypothetical protein
MSKYETNTSLLGESPGCGPSLATSTPVTTTTTPHAQVILRTPEPNPRLPAYIGGVLAWGSPPVAGNSMQVGSSAMPVSRRTHTIPILKIHAILTQPHCTAPS